MVDFGLSEEQKMMQTMAHDFARNVMRPLTEKYYRDGNKIPDEKIAEVMRQANELRILDYFYPEECGGLGVSDTFTRVLMTEELAWGDAGLMVHIGITGLAMLALQAMGTSEQFQEWVKPFCNPEGTARDPKLAAFCLTEPDAGSNVSAMKTVAKKDGDDWLITGTKQFITNGGVADLYVVVAQTNPNANSAMEAAAGLCGFVVEKGTKGLQPGNDYKKWGVLASNTTEVVFDEVRVPAKNQLGTDQVGGMMGVYKMLESSRVSVGAGAVGLARAAFEAALPYAKARVQKKPLIQFQAIGHKLAEMETKIQAARGLVWKAAWMANNKKPFLRGEGSQCKYYCSEIAVEVCLDAIQIHGGYGFMKEYDVGRFLNDAYVFRIWEGTSEIQKNTIVRYLQELEIKS